MATHLLQMELQCSNILLLKKKIFQTKQVWSNISSNVDGRNLGKDQACRI